VRGRQNRLLVIPLKMLDTTGSEDLSVNAPYVFEGEDFWDASSREAHFEIEYWGMARNEQGLTYYFEFASGKTQWEPPQHLGTFL
jgi:hypothetical protein